MSVVGAGGTGSIMLTHLCRIWSAWIRLGGAPFKIAVIDDDVVTESNLARQAFCEADLGQAKATVLAQRMRAFYGIPIEAHVRRWDTGMQHYSAGNVTIGCVDNLKARRSMARCRGYWLDLGNDASSGQVILGGRGLPNFFALHPKLRKAKDPKTVPSCSMAEALEKQDLFINSTVATLGGQLLWQLMRKGGLNHHGYYINLQSGRVAPIPIEVK